MSEQDQQRIDAEAWREFVKLSPEVRDELKTLGERAVTTVFHQIVDQWIEENSSMGTTQSLPFAVPRIAVVNYSTLVGDAEVHSWVPSLQRQVRAHFAPAWGIDAIVVAKAPSEIERFHWVMRILDNSDQAGALGDHDMTPGGKPISNIFVADTKKAGVSISSVCSHELLEVLADPWIDSTVTLASTDGRGTVYAQEVCDPVEGDSYEIWGVQLSNFVTPFWFGDPAPAGTKYDFLGKLDGPFKMTPGGYMSFAQISNRSGIGPWQQSFADERAKVLSQLSRGIKRAW